MHEVLALLQHLLADTMQAVAAQQTAEQSLPATAPIGDIHGADAGVAGCDTVNDLGADPALLPPTQAFTEKLHLQMLHMSIQLAATLSGFITDVLLSAVAGVGGTAAASLAEGVTPCIFPTPSYWSRWVTGHTAHSVSFLVLYDGYAIGPLPLLHALLQDVCMTVRCQTSS